MKDKAEALEATSTTPAASLPQNILVALDASDHANHALCEALRLAGASGGAKR